MDLLGAKLWLPAVFRTVVDFVAWLLPSFDLEFPQVNLFPHSPLLRFDRLTCRLQHAMDCANFLADLCRKGLAAHRPAIPEEKAVASLLGPLSCCLFIVCLCWLQRVLGRKSPKSDEKGASAAVPEGPCVGESAWSSQLVAGGASRYVCFLVLDGQRLRCTCATLWRR